MIDTLKTIPELIMTGLEYANKEEALKTVSKMLWKQGYVKDSFADAIIAREKIYPTGIATTCGGIAIPHTDSEHVIKPAIAIVRLTNPVTFGEMGSESNTLSVDLMMILMLTDSNAQMKLLETIADLLQNPKLLRVWRDAIDDNKFVSLFNLSEKNRILTE